VELIAHVGWSLQTHRSVTPGGFWEYRGIVTNLHVSMEIIAHRRILDNSLFGIRVQRSGVSEGISVKAKGDEAAVSWLPLVPLVHRPGSGREM